MNRISVHRAWRRAERPKVSVVVGLQSTLICLFLGMPASNLSAEEKTAGTLPAVVIEGFAPQIGEQIQKAHEHASTHLTDAAAVGRLGMVLQTYQQLESAAVCYSRARLLQPNEFRWAYFLGTTYASLGLYSQAVEQLRAAVQANPSYLPARLALADSLLASGGLDESLKTFEAMLEEHPETAAAHYGLGRIFSARRDLERAAEHLKQACQLFPNFGAAHYALALAYRDCGKNAEAQTHLSFYQKDKTSWPNLADPVMNEIHQLNLSASSHIKRGVAMEAAGLLEQAAAEHERALEIDSLLLQARINLITLYGKLGQTQKAEQQYRELQKINPNLEESHYNFGVLLFGQGRNEEAAAVFRRALEINPHYAEAHGNYAYLLMTEGRLDEARQHYRLAIDNKPNYRLAHFNLGRILLNQGNNDEAIQEFLLTLSPEDDSTPAYLYALGAALNNSGRRQEALPHLRKARDLASAYQQKELLARIERDLSVIEKR
jgi:superkiller protein 3